uniref:Carbamoyltransferase n=1 Tax=Candidatus Kentrum sp. UNK TaxID=2126344 RepID=A0A451APW1_9GAMM|nr:MAG: carbamoyltransferase [Candidatus Kentron sp. UNK]VFK73326.1 MAG: carbamoyltransferase [Candidatus Kentron sp. UNK]
MKILGIIGRPDVPECHDSSAALIIENRIVCAIEQERLSRRRHAYGEGCQDAVQACLDKAGLTLADIDHIAYGWMEELQQKTPLAEFAAASSELTEIFLPKTQFAYDTTPPIHFFDHHYTHAAATYFTSGLDDAAVLIMDGQGEHVSSSLFHAQGKTIRELETYPIKDSVGLLYGAASAFSGLGWWSEGKFMALASFGHVREEIDFRFDPETGRFSLPAFLEEAWKNPARDEKLHPSVLWWEYFLKYTFPYRQGDGSDIGYYGDFAATVQHTLEQLAYKLAVRLKRLTGAKNLVLGGGCALNCSMNAYLGKTGLFERMYVFPAANDAGCSLGAALSLNYLLNPQAELQPRISGPAFGQEYTREAIAAAIQEYGFTAEELSSDELCERVAADLVDKKIILWFQGQDEFGPRALGRRSFLGNPTDRETLVRLNTIKGREMWRPLAPSVLREQAGIVMEDTEEYGIHRFMLGVAIIRKEWRSRVPAIVHVDFTARPHLVEKDEDGNYWKVIHAFYRKTDIPLLCNTSLNVAGQPIVHTPAEALEIFKTEADVDTLALGDFYLTKTRTE